MTVIRFTVPPSSPSSSFSSFFICNVLNVFGPFSLVSLEDSKLVSTDHFFEFHAEIEAALFCDFCESLRLIMSDMNCSSVKLITCCVVQLWHPLPKFSSKYNCTRFRFNQLSHRPQALHFGQHFEIFFVLLVQFTLENWIVETGHVIRAH